MSALPKVEEFREWNERMVTEHNPEVFHHHSQAVVRWVEGRRVRAVLKLLAAEPEHRVLEIGVGSGHVLAQARGRARHGLDLSPKMLRRAREVVPDARFAAGDAEKLPYRDESFDRIFATSVLSHLLHPDRALEEGYRVLKPGGRLVVSVSDGNAVERGLRIARALYLDRLILRRKPQVQGEHILADEYHLHRFDLEMLRRFAARLPKESRLVKVPSRLYPVHLVALYEKP